VRRDSHVHIVGPPDRYPQAAERTYLADIATLKQLENVSATRAVRRFVIVQPSFYGVDNSLLLESLDALAGRGRGVAVINPRVTSARTLATYAKQGVSRPAHQSLQSLARKGTADKSFFGYRWPSLTN
jgi:predicted TIM-barrel fold metal-dependent hydrolase